MKLRQIKRSHAKKARGCILKRREEEFGATFFPQEVVSPENAGMNIHPDFVLPDGGAKYLTIVRGKHRRSSVSEDGVSNLNNYSFVPNPPIWGDDENA